MRRCSFETTEPSLQKQMFLVWKTWLQLIRPDKGISYHDPSSLHQSHSSSSRFNTGLSVCRSVLVYTSSRLLSALPWSFVCYYPSFSFLSYFLYSNLASLVLKVYLLFPTFHLPSLLRSSLSYFLTSNLTIVSFVYIFHTSYSFLLPSLKYSPSFLPSFLISLFACFFLLCLPFFIYFLPFNFPLLAFFHYLSNFFLSLLCFLLPSIKYLSFVSVSYSFLSWFLYFFLVFFASFLQIFPFFLFILHCILQQYYACQDYRQQQLAFYYPRRFYSV